MTLSDFNPDDNDNTAQDGKELTDKSNIHETVCETLDEMDSQDSVNFESVNGVVQCDYDVLAEYITFMVTTAVKKSHDG